MEELVSIIAPSYNHEIFIENCLWSVANQTYINKELIIIDDHSADQTPYLIQQLIDKEEFKKNFSNIIFIVHPQNKGAHNSINEGIHLSNGKYTTIINTDDLYQKNRLEILINTIEKEEAEFVFSKVETIDANNNIVKNNEGIYYETLQKKILQYPSINLALLTDNVAISTGNMLFKKSLFEKIEDFHDYKYIHDWDFILRATLVTEPIYTDLTSYLYRLHDTNTFKVLKDDQELCYKESFSVLSQYCKAIKQHTYKNNRIPDVDVWQYFIKDVICNGDIGHIWKLS